MYKVVITGGPHSGKTKLVEAFGSEGYKTIPESAMGVIGVLNALIGVDEQINWRIKHPNAFQSLLAPRQLREEALVQAGEGDFVFLDRSALDNIAYSELNGAEIPGVLKNFRHDYNLAVICATLSNYDQRAGTGRTSNRARSLVIRDALRETYQRYGIPIFELPEMNIENRVVAIKKKLGIL